jgi:hypothetical protein
MTNNDNTSRSTSRRTVLKTIGVTGIAASAGHASADEGSDHRVDLIQLGFDHDISIEGSDDPVEFANTTVFPHTIENGHLYLFKQYDDSHPVKSEEYVAVPQFGDSSTFRSINEAIRPFPARDYVPTSLSEDLRTMKMVPVESEFTYEGVELTTGSSNSVTMRYRQREKELSPGDSVIMNIGDFEVNVETRSESGRSYTPATSTVLLKGKHQGELDVVENKE